MNSPGGLLLRRRTGESNRWGLVMKMVPCPWYLNKTHSEKSVNYFFKPLVEKYIQNESVSHLSSEIAFSSQVIGQQKTRSCGCTKLTPGCFPAWSLSHYHSSGQQAVLCFVWG